MLKDFAPEMNANLRSNPLTASNERLVKTRARNSRPTVYEEIWALDYLTNDRSTPSTRDFAQAHTGLTPAARDRQPSG